jgi:cytochrome c-type biogenesis protein CcmH
MTSSICLRWALGLLIALSAISPWAQAEAPAHAITPAAQARFDTIAEELRCLVCQNQSLASSQAGLAMDLREEVHGLIAQGFSDAQIRDFLVQRYGDFVLYDPPFKPLTWLLWLGPLLLLAGGLIALQRVLRPNQAPATAPPPLSEAQRRQAQALLRSETRHD